MSLLLVFGCNGCSKSQSKFGTVSGVVRLNAAPVAGAFIVFTPEEGRTSTAETDAEGRYSLSYTVNQRGAVIGKHRVSIESPAGPDADQAVGGENRQRLSIPTKYNSKTTLIVDVGPGENTIDFDLHAP